MAFIGLVTAAVVACLVGLLLLRIGSAVGFVDRPDDPALKVHRRPAVPLGGVAVLTGLLAGWTLAGGLDPVLVGIAGLVVLLGLMDDRLDLPPRLRLGAEVGLGLLVVASDSTPLDVGSPTDVVIGVVLIVVAVNAVNLFDGLDALAGSASLIAFAGLSALAALRGVDTTLPLLMVGAVSGFLVLNRPPARLFLGDNGSYLIGLMLAVAIFRSSPDGADIGLAIASVVLGVFVLDLAVTVLRRRLAGRPLFAGDRSHLYDRLHDRGWSMGSIAGAAALAEATFVLIALAIDRWIRSWWSVLAVAVAGLFLVVSLARRTGSSRSGFSG